MSRQDAGLPQLGTEVFLTDAIDLLVALRDAYAGRVAPIVISGWLGSEYRSILDRFPHVNVLGGCRGTDHEHGQAIAQACVRR